MNGMEKRKYKSNGIQGRCTFITSVKTPVLISMQKTTEFFKMQGTYAILFLWLGLKPGCEIKFSKHKGKQHN